MPAYVGASLTELLQLFRKTRTLKLDGRLDNGEEAVMGHFIRGKSHDFKISGQEASSFLESYQDLYSLIRGRGLTRPKSAGNYVQVSATIKSIKKV